MKLLPKGTTSALRKKRLNQKRKLKAKKNQLRKAKAKIQQRRKTLKDLKKGFIEKYVTRNTAQLRRDDKRMKQMVDMMDSQRIYKKKKVLNHLKKLNKRKR